MGIHFCPSCCTFDPTSHFHPGEAVDDDLSPWDTIHIGDWEKAVGAQLQISSTLCSHLWSKTVLVERPVFGAIMTEKWILKRINILIHGTYVTFIGEKMTLWTWLHLRTLERISIVLQWVELRLWQHIRYWSIIWFLLLCFWCGFLWLWCSWEDRGREGPSVFTLGTQVRVPSCHCFTWPTRGHCGLSRSGPADGRYLFLLVALYLYLTLPFSPSSFPLALIFYLNRQIFPKSLGRDYLTLSV